VVVNSVVLLYRSINGLYFGAISLNSTLRGKAGKRTHGRAVIEGRNMRRDLKKRRKLAARKSLTRLRGSPVKRLAALEEKLESFAGRLLYVERNLGINFQPEEIQKRPGPSPKIPDDVLFETRDALIDWLEYHWPDLRVLMQSGRARTKKNFETDLRLTEGSGQPWSPIVRNFVNEASQLAKFLRSERFKRAPPRGTVLAALKGQFEDEKRRKAANRLPTRQIANAMAGVPSLKWRTSLDKCSRNPSRMVVGRRTEEYYRNLYAGSTPIEVAERPVASETVPKPD
jgi:hypothetical protein